MKKIIEKNSYLTLLVISLAVAVLIILNSEYPVMAICDQVCKPYWDQVVEAWKTGNLVKIISALGVFLLAGVICTLFQKAGEDFFARIFRWIGSIFR